MSTNAVDTVAVIALERAMDAGSEVRDALAPSYSSVECVPYNSGVIADRFASVDAIVGVMATGILIRKIAPLLDSKWADPAVVGLDTELTWAIPLVGGHHGANALARQLAVVGATPAVTTATEVTAKTSVETRAKALDAQIETPDSTVATNLAVLEDDLGPVARLDGPQAVLVSEDVTVMRRTEPAGIVLGTGCVSGVDAEQVRDAWDRTLADLAYTATDVEFVATGALKKDEPGLQTAAAEYGVGVVYFDRETLRAHEGPSQSKATELRDWPGIAEASAIAGGRKHELVAPKTAYNGAVTVAIGR